MNDLGQGYKGGEPLKVAAGEAHIGVNAELVEGGVISGRVTDAVSHAGLSGIGVGALNQGAGRGNGAYSSANGEYKIVGLATGTYKVLFEEEVDEAFELKYLPQYFNSASSLAGSSAPWVRAMSFRGPIKGTRWHARSPPRTHTVALPRTAPACRYPVATVIRRAPPLPPRIILKLSGGLFVARGATHIHIACSNAPCAGVVELVEQIKRRGAHGKGSHIQTVLLAKAPYALAAGRSTSVVLRLTAVGRTALAHARRHRLSVIVLASLTGGTTLHGTATLRAAAVKRR